MAKYFKNLSDPDFFSFQGSFESSINSNGAGWGIPAGKITALASARANYEPVYRAITNKMTRTSAQVRDHQAARRSYSNFISAFSKEFIISNSAISRSQVTAMGFNRRKEKYSARPQITEGVFGSIDAMGGSRIMFTCRTATDSSRPSLHKDADMVEVKYAIGTSPDTVGDCPFKEVSSKAKFMLSLNDADAGEKIYAYLRWRNNRRPEKSGPWSTRIESGIL